MTGRNERDGAADKPSAAGRLAGYTAAIGAGAYVIWDVVIDPLCDGVALIMPVVADAALWVFKIPLGLLAGTLVIDLAVRPLARLLSAHQARRRACAALGMTSADLEAEELSLRAAWLAKELPPEADQLFAPAASSQPARFATTAALVAAVASIVATLRRGGSRAA